MLNGTPNFPCRSDAAGDHGAARSAEPVWILCYGSLMWDADFPVPRPSRLLRGYHRSFCLYS
jgi:cation transport regulator ChaC